MHHCRIFSREQEHPTLERSHGTASEGGEKGDSS